MALPAIPHPSLAVVRCHGAPGLPHPPCPSAQEGRSPPQATATPTPHLLSYRSASAVAQGLQLWRHCVKVKLTLKLQQSFLPSHWSRLLPTAHLQTDTVYKDTFTASAGDWRETYFWSLWWRYSFPNWGTISAPWPQPVTKYLMV